MLKLITKKFVHTAPRSPCSAQIQLKEQSYSEAWPWLGPGSCKAHMELHRTENLAAGFHPDPGRTHQTGSPAFPSAPPHLGIAGPHSPCSGFPDPERSPLSSLQQQYQHSTKTADAGSSSKSTRKPETRKSPSPLLSGRSPGGSDWLVREQRQEHLP